MNHSFRDKLTGNEYGEIEIFIHNMSGIKSKISALSNGLATCYYKIVCVQETWLDNSIADNEIIEATEFRMFRRDRSQFLSTKIGEGGVMILVHNEIEHEEIVIKMKTSIEIQSIRIKISYTVTFVS